MNFRDSRNLKKRRDLKCENSRKSESRFCLNLQLSRYVISNLLNQCNFSLCRMRINESSFMIVLIIYHFERPRIVIAVVHAFFYKRKETFDASISDMTSFFFSCISQSIISIAYNSSFSLHSELEIFSTKKHYSIIFRDDILVNFINKILQWFKDLFVWWKK